jgi:sugar phosphate isomerase/epimerase
MRKVDQPLSLVAQTGNNCWKTGLLSVTFRDQTVDQIIGMTKKAGLDGIEWGGDIHVPAGDLKNAEKVGRATEQAGLQVSAYGSYYRCDGGPDGNREWIQCGQEVVETAQALGAPIVRIWAGRKGSLQCSPGERKLIIGRILHLADLAADSGIRVGIEFHPGTLTDTNNSALELMRQIGHPNVYSYWQPVPGKSIRYRADGLRLLVPYLCNLHVFHWGPAGGTDRRELSEGRSEWEIYLGILEEAEFRSWMSLEFVRNNSPEQFYRDSKTLRTMIESRKLEIGEYSYE